MKRAWQILASVPLVLAAVRVGPACAKTLVAHEEGRPVVLEINQEGQSIRELEMTVSGGGVALSAHRLARGELAMVRASGLAGSPGATGKFLWIATTAAGDEPVRIREGAGSMPRLVPLPTEEGVALLYVAEDGDDRIEFLDDRGETRYPGTRVPGLSVCEATAVRSEELLLACNDRGDSRLFRATSDGIREEARVLSTNEVRPPILFEQKGILHEVTVGLEATAESEKLLWKWSGTGK